MGQRLLLSLPAVAAAIVAWAVLAEGGGRVRYAQVLGGPTGTTSSLLVRTLALERDGRVVPNPGLAVRLIVESGGARATLAGSTDATGQLELRLDADNPATDPWLRVEAEEPLEVLAEGKPSLAPARWREAARRSGGWLAGQTRGPLRVRAAAESGTFAVPFEGALIVQVLEARPDAAARAPGARHDLAASADIRASAADERPLAGAELQIELDGALLAEQPQVTAEAGLSRIALVPAEHAVSARVVASSGERKGEWYGVLPVTPGALVATREGSTLRVRSPIARERAFASIVSQSARIAGAIIPLAGGADGTASGSWALDVALLARIEREPTWVVVASEYDKRSAGVVGWPLTPAGFDPALPKRSFDVADAVLLDGRAGAILAAASERAGRRRLAAGALFAVGLLMTASFWRAVRLRGAGSAPPDGATELNRTDTITTHAAPHDTSRETPLRRGGWVLLLALCCIVLGLGGLAYFGLTH